MTLKIAKCSVIPLFVHTSLTVTKWLPYMEKQSGASTFCLFGQDALAQIILGSDYSGFMKDLR